MHSNPEYLKKIQHENVVVYCVKGVCLLFLLVCVYVYCIYVAN